MLCLFQQFIIIKYPVVSIPNGANAAAKSIAANIEFLEGFDEVVFMLDNDEEGRKAAIECSTCLLLLKLRSQLYH